MTRWRPRHASISLAGGHWRASYVARCSPIAEGQGDGDAFGVAPVLEEADPLAVALVMGAPQFGMPALLQLINVALWLRARPLILAGRQT